MKLKLSKQEKELRRSGPACPRFTTGCLMVEAEMWYQAFLPQVKLTGKLPEHILRADMLKSNKFYRVSLPKKEVLAIFRFVRFRYTGKGTEVMTPHLKSVVELCEQHGLQVTNKETKS